MTFIIVIIFFFFISKHLRSRTRQFDFRYSEKLIIWLRDTEILKSLRSSKWKGARPYFKPERKWLGIYEGWARSSVNSPFSSVIQTKQCSTKNIRYEEELQNRTLIGVHHVNLNLVIYKTFLFLSGGNLFFLFDLRLDIRSQCDIFKLFLSRDFLAKPNLCEVPTERQ